MNSIAIFGATSNASDVFAGIVGLLLLLVIAIIGLGMYFLPTIIVVLRKKKNNVGAIIVLNFLAGWTFLGWMAALIWSLTSDPVPVVVNANQYYQPYQPQDPGQQ